MIVSNTAYRKMQKPPTERHKTSPQKDTKPARKKGIKSAHRKVKNHPTERRKTSPQKDAKTANKTDLKNKID